MKTSTMRTITRWVFLLFGITALAAIAAAEDPVWPRQITKPGGKLVLYQPQVDDWQNFQQVDGRMAFTITPTGGKTHVGVITVQMQSAVNMDAHTVFLIFRPRSWVNASATLGSTSATASGLSPRASRASTM